VLHHLVSFFNATPGPGGGVIQNPPPAAPPDVTNPVETLLGYVKWGVLVVIVTAGFVGAGAVAGGRVFAHHGASKVGIGILLSALAGAVLYVGIYAIITSIAK
jgi:hypothetical protein